MRSSVSGILFRELTPFGPYPKFFLNLVSDFAVIFEKESYSTAPSTSAVSWTPLMQLKTFLKISTDPALALSETY